MINSANKYKKIAKFSLVIIQFLLFANVIIGSSKLLVITAPTVDTVMIQNSVMPNMYTAMVLVLLSIVGLVLYYYEKYFLVLIVAVISMAAHMGIVNL